jgi:hypothetical protein
MAIFMILMHFYTKLCTMLRHRLRGEAILDNHPFQGYIFLLKQTRSEVVIGQQNVS